MSLSKRGKEIADEVAEMLCDVRGASERVFCDDDLIDMAYDFVETSLPELMERGGDGKKS